MTVDRDLFSAENCSVKRALDIVGEKWTLLVLREALYGARRFERFQSRIGCPRQVLTDRLNTLVAAGVLRKVPYQEPGQRERHEYRLTEKGRDLLPAVIALMHWGDKWEADAAGPPVEVVHRECGHPVELILRCRDDHAPLTAHDTEPRPGPGARPAKTGKTSR
ncbi:winged helix-turn-helix transcriptional regulator [Mycolicibacterium aichiense]|uniref:HxlR family transcriptional regulator n=1 Tax=Mycolicibacterium aichiense TaxID=1799 RepID=A0AAD1HNU6_9MYCO|nr:helix-turn-helix domain-containing protein [Mycolicibacterium aichiense]MCV7018795.1 helix-turn-helix transcriptional regulator [Mycolicibacterium aichiense]BBX08665.1 HxlR family transcriptional regulator [Mycolicibacterium aichiense]STZ82460.1 transcriptional regulatory protein [Mycolicibacterium aichiense]